MHIQSVNNQQNFSAKGDFVSRLNPNRLARVSSMDERIVQYPVGDKHFAEVMYEITSDAEKHAWDFNFANPEVRNKVFEEVGKKLNIRA